MRPIRYMLVVISAAIIVGGFSHGLALGQASPASVRITNANGSIAADVNASHQLLVAASFTPSGTQDVNLVKVGGSAVALGQTTMAASLPVAIASNQTPVPVSGSVTVSGTVAATQGTSPWVTSGTATVTPVVYTSVLTGQQAVTNSATALPSHACAEVKLVPIAGGSVSQIFYGPTGITTSTGFPLQLGQALVDSYSNTANIFVIASGSGTSVAWECDNP